MLNDTYAVVGPTVLNAIKETPPLWGAGVSQLTTEVLSILRVGHFDPDSGDFVIPGPYCPPLPDETQYGVKWDGVVGYYVTGNIGSRIAYYALRDVLSVSFSPGPIINENKPPQGTVNQNDFLVTRNSAEFNSIYVDSPFTTPNGFFFQGKMHGNVCDDEVGRKVVAEPTVVIPRR